MSLPMDEGRWLNRIRINYEEFIEKYKLIFLNRRDSKDEDFTDDVLRVSSIDANIRNNVKSHHTDEFDITDANVYDKREFLVIRRGQQFTMTIRFNRNYDPKTDDLRLIFQFGKTPLPSKETHVEFVLSDKDDPKDWGAFIKDRDGTSLEVVFMTPATCAVGKWFLKVDVLKRGEESTTVYRHEHSSPIYVLFNPWCKDDAVYMKEDDLKQEYVLNENGRIFVGDVSSISGRPWIFGQFSGDVLDSVIYLLDKKSNLPDHCRGDSVVVVRKISSLVNCNDNRGVLWGKWNGNYDDGTSPLEWTGSVQILEEFFKTKKPVKYGQCWVFSGVVTTVCRALGIPARSVTNFASAHDKDGSTTIDNFYNSDFKHIDDISDSTWNFHVWNEVWMKRQNLPAMYSGWQAIDATPQEVSMGYFQMGPMPVLAVKHGDINVPYDGGFLFAEVNGDALTWLLDKSGSMLLLRTDKNSTGKCLSTKTIEGHRGARGREWTDREDITDQYKFPEGSEEERDAVKRAGQYASSGKRETVYSAKEDVEIVIKPYQDILLGEPINVELKIKNTSESQRTLNGTLKLTSLFYTGISYKIVEELQIRNCRFEAKEETDKTVSISYESYKDVLQDHCLFKISCMFTVMETKQVYTKIQNFSLNKPDLTIKAPDVGCVGEKIEVQVFFKNPLAVTLTKCELRVEGPGHQKPVTYKQPDVPYKQTFTSSFDMTPVKPGQKEIIVFFNCRQMSAVNGTHPIKIEP